jgi:hypothetical protein
MKMKFFALFIATILGLQAMSPAWAEAPAVPTNITVGKLDAFAYWFAKKLVIDIDAALKSQGIDSQVCTFRQKDPTQDFSYPGLGQCLYKDFMKSMKTEGLAGVVYTWILDKQGRYHPVEIQWRPPRGGWGALISQVVEMRLEKPLYYIRDFIWGEEAGDKLRYTEFLGGDLKIILPEDPEAMAVLAARGGMWAKNYLANVRSIDLHLAPTAAEKGKVIYDGSLIMNNRAAEDGHVDTTKVALRTNVNVVVLKRSFFLKAKVRQNGASEDPLPVLGSEVLP